MKTSIPCYKYGLVLVSLALTLPQPTSACTGIRILAGDGAIIYARTMENALDLQSQLIVVPRGKEYVGSGPDNKPGLKWTVKYGFVGPNALDQPFICDGLNEKGLAVGHFQFTDFAGFQTPQPKDAGRTIASFEVGTFLLSTCCNVKEAVAALKAVCVWQVGNTARDRALGEFHYVVHDAGGHCLVLEYVDGQLKVHENPLGVVANSPSFDWHLTNLRNYLRLSVASSNPVNLRGLNLVPFCQGTGLVGLPGDFTSPSRFIRAVVFTQATTPCAGAEVAVQRAFHLLNHFDIPAGSVWTKGEGAPLCENTLWTTAADLKNLRYYFHTVQSRQVRFVDLRKVDLKATEIKIITMRDREVIEDVSGRAK
jgi:choloylglycine hydrolase